MLCGSRTNTTRTNTHSGSREALLSIPATHEALIVEPLRGTPLPVQATPFSRRFLGLIRKCQTWFGAMPVFLRRWHGDIPTSPRINLFQRILLIGKRFSPDRP